MRDELRVFKDCIWDPGRSGDGAWVSEPLDGCTSEAVGEQWVTHVERLFPADRRHLFEESGLHGWSGLRRRMLARATARSRPGGGYGPRLPGFPVRLDSAAALRRALELREEHHERRRRRTPSLALPHLLTSDVLTALERAQSGHASRSDLTLLWRAAREAGLLWTGAGEDVATDRVDAERPASPGGQLEFLSGIGGLRVHPERMDEGLFAGLRRWPERWVAWLALWDAVVLCVAEGAGTEAPLSPGLVFDQGTLAGVGMRSHHRGLVVYLGAEWLHYHLTEAPLSPIGLAVLLHQIASHEVAHVAVGLAVDHDPTFNSQREDIAAVTAGRVQVIAEWCRDALVGAARPVIAEVG